MATFHFTTYDGSYGRQFFVTKKEALNFFRNAPCDCNRELKQGNYHLHLEGEFYYSSGKEYCVGF